MTPRGGFDVKIPVPGEHNIKDALAAIAVGEVLEIGHEHMREALAAFKAPEKRSNVVPARRGFVVIDDTYNASPASVHSALKTLKMMEGGRKIAVLGDMLELGEHAAEEHLKLGRAAKETGVDMLVVVGELAGLIARGAIDAGMPVSSVLEFDESWLAAQGTPRKAARAGRGAGQGLAGDEDGESCGGANCRVRFCCSRCRWRVAFVMSMLIAPLVIACLKRGKVGQTIQEDGPESHLSKAGTPTMGGIIIIVGILVGVGALLYVTGKRPMPASSAKHHQAVLLRRWRGLIALLVLVLGYGLLGAVDDYLTIRPIGGVRGICQQAQGRDSVLLAVGFVLWLRQTGFSPCFTIGGQHFYPWGGILGSRGGVHRGDGEFREHHGWAGWSGFGLGCHALRDYVHYHADVRDYPTACAHVPDAP